MLFVEALLKKSIWQLQLNWCCFGKPGSVFNSFSAHYATLLCFLYWLLLLSPLVCPCREEQTSTVSEAEGDLGLLFTLSITMYSSPSSVVLTWSTVLLPLDLFEKEKSKKNETKKAENRTFRFLTLLLWSARPSLKSVLALSRRSRMKRQTEHGGKLWC